MNNKQSSHTPTLQEVQLIKIAIDMHRDNYRVVRQLDHSVPQPAQRFTREKFFLWLEKQKQQAPRVVVCYEAGCFGYGPARHMIQMGVEALVIAPQNWDEQQKKQVNDKLDAQVMCRRLSEYLDGHRKALSIVHIPTVDEELARGQGRFRHQLRGEIRRMRAMGRSLLLLQELAVRGKWWRGATWQLILDGMPLQIIRQLEVWKALIESMEKQAVEVEKELEKKAEPDKQLFGEGALTHVLLALEMIDMTRFANRRQVANYFGLCPSESSSGQSRRLGSITKHGNPRLRVLMVELAWRLFMFQPDYVGFAKWREVLQDKKASGAARKKAIVAVARRLAVDIWRIRTGKAKPEDLRLRIK
jgi:transposase